MAAPAPNEVTRMLEEMTAGDSRAASKLLPLVYDELRGLAGRYLAGERAGHTLQPTALVHEAFIKLVGQERAKWENRAHFYCVASLAMRRILVNHARDRGRLKRGGGVRTFELREEDALDLPDDELLAIDEALERLGKVDERKVQIVQLRFFGGFGLEQTARILGVSPAQVKREWTMARAFLVRELGWGPG